jgi:hypothetical protein
MPKTCFIILGRVEKRSIANSEHVDIMIDNKLEHPLEATNTSREEREIWNIQKYMARSVVKHFNGLAASNSWAEEGEKLEK